MSKLFDFKTQLAVGDLGEQTFARHYPKATRLDGRKGDFELPDGRKVELKTDSYSPDRTPNFFMERYSSFEKKSPGGPWQAKLHGVELFVYGFASDSFRYWFETNKLVEWLEANEPSYRPMMVRNKGWQALGLLVPRASLKHLEIEVPECLK